MPQRSVIREDKVTKVRIVFDVGFKGNEVKSLNDCFCCDPYLSSNILDIILRFRLHELALSGDIEKAFLQIQIEEEDRIFLRFLWFDNIGLILKVFRMSHVTFVVTTSAFFSFCNQIKGYKDLFKKYIVNTLYTSLYVDDLFHRAVSLKKLLFYRLVRRRY